MDSISVPSNQIPAGLYAHGCYEEGHRQMFKQYRRLGENAGLGPRYRAEGYDAEGHIIPWRFQNYPANLAILNTVIEGVFRYPMDQRGTYRVREFTLALGKTV